MSALQSHVPLWRLFMLAVLLLALVCLNVEPAQAQPKTTTLEQAMDKLAADLMLALKNKSNTIQIGAYTGDAFNGFTAGPAIGRKLGECLQRMNVRVNRASNYSVRGEYVAEKQPSSDQFAVHIRSVLYGKDSMNKPQELLKFESVVYDVKDVAVLTGNSAVLPVLQDERQALPGDAPTAGALSRDQQAAELRAQADALSLGAEKPHVRIVRNRGNTAKSEITVGESSPYALEILVRDADGQFRPREPKLEDGLPFVAIRPDEVYRVRILNYSDYDCGVTLTIDGLSTFTFSENAAYKAIDKWVVDAHQFSDIPGWHLRNLPPRNNEYSEFKVTSFGKSPAAQLGAADRIGTITAVFCAAWKPNEQPPEGELQRIVKAGTGQGQSQVLPAREASRQFGKARMTISVRYERNDPPDLPPRS